MAHAQAPLEGFANAARRVRIPPSPQKIENALAASKRHGSRTHRYPYSLGTSGRVGAV